MTNRIATLGLKWKAFRTLFDFVPTDAELARGPFQLGEDNGAQVLSKMLSGDQGVPLDLLQIMADRINRQAVTHRATRAVQTPLGDLAVTAVDLAHASLFEFLRRLVALSPAPDPDRLDRLHRDVLEALTTPVAGEGDLRFTVQKLAATRSFAPFRDAAEDTLPVFEPGRDLGQFLIRGGTGAAGGASPLVYVFLRRDPASLGRRVWETSFPDTVLWLPSPFPLVFADGVANLFAEPVPVLPEPGHYRAHAVLVRDREALRSIDPRLDRRRPVGDTPPAVRFDEAGSFRFLTNVNRALDRRDAAVSVAIADYVVAEPAGAAPAS